MASVELDGGGFLARVSYEVTQDVALKNMRRWLPYSLEEILPTLSENPAKEMGLWDRKGSIETGKIADFVVCSPDYREKTVYLAGEKL